MDRCIHDLAPAMCSVCNGLDREVKSIRGRPPMKEKWADDLFEVIPVAPAPKLSNADLADAAGLTGPQVTAAVAYLRDNYPELPLVSSPEGYCFTLDEADINRFRLARTRSALTIYRRLWRGVVKPYIDKRVDAGALGSMEARLIAKQFERLLEDLEEMTAA